MSDRTSAGIFARVFEHLAINPDDRPKRLALELWRDAANYDFHWRQMEADEALIALGLAKVGHDPDYPEEGELVLYRDGRGWSQ